MKYFDAHSHIQFPQYDEDRDVLIETMRTQGFGSIVVGVDKESSEKAVALASAHEHLFASVGLHPNDTPEETFDELFFKELLQNPNVVSIGECGLDYFRPNEPEKEKSRQKNVFESHIHLAAQSHKPLMIHARPSKGSQDAYRDAIEMLKSAKRKYGDALTGNMHFFVGGIEEAREFVDLDFTLSYTAVLTFTHDYDDVVRFAPLSHLITETDSPYAAPAPNRGKRNSPLAVQKVVEAIAAIRNEDLETVRVNILQNVRRVFTISPEII